MALSEFHRYYIKGRVFEWTFALAMFFSGLELLVWEIARLGVTLWLLEVISQKWLGTILFFVGWIRVSSLMFNGQLLFGYRLGLGLRAICAVLGASLWAQFAVALFISSIEQGVPSVGIPFWTMFTVAEFFVAYAIGAEWKK